LTNIYRTDHVPWYTIFSIAATIESMRTRGCWRPPWILRP